MLRLKPNGIASAASGLLLAAGVAFARGLGSAGTATAAYMALSDGCFVAGLLFSGFGLLLWISTTGFFDIFGYGFRSIIVLFSAFRKPQDHESFLEYKATRAAKRQKPMWSVLATGCALIILSLVFVYLHYQV